MAGKVRHLLEREGRFWARLVVPVALRGIVGRRELLKPLGPDRVLALRSLPRAVADMQSELEAARHQLAKGGAVAKPQPRGRRLTVEQIARDHHQRQIAIDAEIREMDRPYAGQPFDERYVADLRRAKSGEASNQELAETVGEFVREYKVLGNTDVTPTHPEFRRLAQALAVAEYEALVVAAARDEGVTEAKTTHPLLVAPTRPAASTGSERLISVDSVKTLSEILPRYIAEKKSRPGTEYEYAVAVRMFEEFLGEARPIHTITRADVLGYKRALMETPANYTKRFEGATLPEAIRANKARAQPFPVLNTVTINDKWLARLRALLKWLVVNDALPDDPSSGIKVDATASTAPTRVPFTPGDLARIFGPPLFDGQTRDERHWALVIALHTGFRASEIAQLRMDSVRHERGLLVFAIEEEVKTRGSTRLTPVHSTLIRLGIEERVATLRAAGQDRLFPDWFRRGEALRGRGAAKINQPFSQVIPRWFNRTYLPSVGIVDDRKVFHSFRHTLKTALARAGVPRSISDDITGHDDRTAGGKYVHETSVEAMREALERIHLDGFKL